MNKELELYKEFLNIIEFPVKSHLLNSNDKPTLERYRVLRTQIENTLKRLEVLEKPKEIVGTTTVDKALEQFLIDSCLEVKKKLKALEIIKEFATLENNTIIIHIPNHEITENGIRLIEENIMKFDLLKEVLL